MGRILIELDNGEYIEKGVSITNDDRWTTILENFLTILGGLGYSFSSDAITMSEVLDDFNREKFLEEHPEFSHQEETS